MFNTICIACIIIGILIPFCSIVLNLFDGFVDFISIDIFQLELIFCHFQLTACVYGR